MRGLLIWTWNSVNHIRQRENIASASIRSGPFNPLKVPVDTARHSRILKRKMCKISTWCGGCWGDVEGNVRWQSNLINVSKKKGDHWEKLLHIVTKLNSQPPKSGEWTKRIGRPNMFLSQRAGLVVQVITNDGGQIGTPENLTLVDYRNPLCLWSHGCELIVLNRGSLSKHPYPDLGTLANRTRLECLKLA